MDHSERVAAELAAAANETAEERNARVDAIIASRVPDVRFLIDYLLGASLNVDQDRIGLVGHSFGGWTVLAVPERDDRIGSVVAMGPGGSSRPLPGILPLSLTFGWDRDVPVLFLAAEDDVPIPLNGVRELFDRTPGPSRMYVLRRADHQHFLDDVEGEHEALRAMTLPGEAAWIPDAMRPMSELCPGPQAHDFVRGLTLAHLDATLRGSDPAGRFLAAGADSALAARGVDAAELAGC
jgi:dienelactone hydrolase